jgi:CDP-glycerol glycerophosphotransferase (TagB/SpsB family)
MDYTALQPLREEYVVLVRQHPFVKKPVSIPEQCRDFCREITGELTTEELLLVAQLCVTDYSSIVFESALLEKPIYFLADDLDSYYDERGFYYPYREFVPGPIVTTTQMLVEEIGRSAQYDMHRLKEFKARYMGGCDGGATQRIIAFATAPASGAGVEKA